MRKALPLIALAIAGCGSEEDPAGPSAPPADFAATALPSFVQITTGGGHTCAVTKGGLIYCWGSNAFGQLGDGTTQNRLTPVQVKGGTHRFRRVTAGSYHTCAETTEGQAYCWGGNYYGQLGIGGTTGASRLTPVAVAGGLTFSQVQAGFRHTCGVSFNTAFCWGDNQFGQLGDPGSAGFSRRSPFRVAGSLALKSVDPADQHTCGLTTAGLIYCWGRNANGQLGDGTSAYHLSPLQIAGSRLYKQVSTGTLHSCALGTDDKAYCWGDNSAGQIGDGTTTRRFVPTAVAGARKYQGLSAGAGNNCAYDFAGHSWCWGINVYGVVGDGTTTTRLTPVATLGGLIFERLNTWGHSCGVTSAGKAYCWGINANGELGDGTRTNRLRPRLVGGT